MEYPCLVEKKLGLPRTDPDQILKVHNTKKLVLKGRASDFSFCSLKVPLTTLGLEKIRES